LRLLPATRGSITIDDLSAMKPTALFVNTSRSEVIEPGALESALKAGRPGFAAVDVYEREPIYGADHPLLGLDNVLATPHIGYVEKDTYEHYFGIAIEQLLAWRAGSPVNVLNPQALVTPGAAG
jgi:D-3-phosphoglycerate dehydrogenase